MLCQLSRSNKIRLFDSSNSGCEKGGIREILRETEDSLEVREPCFQCSPSEEHFLDKFSQ